MAFRIKGVHLSGVYFQMSKYSLHEGQKTGTEMWVSQVKQKS